MSTCRHGHEMTSDNTYVRTNGKRECRRCTRERIRNAQASRPEGVKTVRPRTDDPWRMGTEWMARARCRDQDTEQFYPERGHSDVDHDAKAFCNDNGGCPVKTDCLIYGLIRSESGIWGGTNESDRDAIRSAMWKRRNQ